MGGDGAELVLAPPGCWKGYVDFFESAEVDIVDCLGESRWEWLGEQGKLVLLEVA